jgi:hypothetical protein
MSGKNLFSGRFCNWLFTISLASVSLAGCTMSSAFPPPYSVPAGSTITINKELPVKPNSLRVTMQYGKIIDRSDVESYYPNCHFELYTLSDEPRTIEPDEVTITRFVNQTHLVSSGMLMYAGLAISGGFGGNDGGPPMAEVYVTDIYLHSEKQPDLYTLTCQHWEDPYDGDYLTMSQIQEALGDLATIKPK